MKNRRSCQWLLMCVLLLPLGAHAITLTPNSNGSGQLPSGHAEITFNTSDGNWVRNIALPRNPTDGARVTINSSAGYWSGVDTSRLKPALSELRLDRGDSYSFTYRSGNGGYWQITGGNSVDVQSPNTVGPFIRYTSRKLLVYTLGNGDWVPNIVLPAVSVDGHRIAIVSFAQSSSRVEVNNLVAKVMNGDTYVYRYNSRDGGWKLEYSLGQQDAPNPDPDPPGVQSTTLTPNSNGGGQLPSGINEITFNTGDGNWVRNIALPRNPTDGARVTINSSAGYWSGVDTSRLKPAMSELRLYRGDSYSFTYRSGNGGYWQITGGSSVDLYSPNTVGSNIPQSSRKLVVYTLGNGDWVPNIVLPAVSVDGHRIAIVSFAQSSSEVDARYQVSNTAAKVMNGDTYVFKYTSRDGGWIVEDSPGRQDAPSPDSPGAQSTTLTPNSNGGGQLPSGLNEITFNTSNGNWVKDISLPQNPPDGARVTINASAQLGSTIDASRVQLGLGQFRVRTGSSVSFTYRATGDFWQITGGDFTSFYSPNTVGSNIPNSSKSMSVYTLGNGNWVDNIVLPTSSADGNLIAVFSSAGQDTKVDPRHRVLSDTARVKNGDVYVFRYSSDHGGWLTESSPVRVIKAADLGNGTFSPTSPTTRIEFGDGNFVRDLNLPRNAGDGDRLFVTSSASFTANINNVKDIGTAKLDTNSEYELVFVAKDRQWVLVNKIPSTVYRAASLQGGKIPRLIRPRTIIEMWNGNWTDKIYLPIGAPKGYQVTVRSQAQSSSAVHGIDNDNEKSVPVKRGQTIAFKVDNSGTWKQETVTIDILLVYSDRLAQRMGEQAVRARAIEGFSLTNDALENSNANFRLRMAGLAQVTADPNWQPDLNRAMRALRDFPEVQDRLKRLNADAVYYFGTEEGCGWALLNAKNPKKENMVGAENVGCGVTTMRHEFGHMMGIDHEPAPNKTTDGYGFGYRPSRTILNGNAIPYYSSPKLLSPNYGVPMGIEGKIDAVRLMNEHSKGIAAFR